jgi:hypothetical protein
MLRPVVDRITEEAMKEEKLPLLAAYGDKALSVEAAEQLVRLAEDATLHAATGEDLPMADKEKLLRKVALQNTR